MNDKKSKFSLIVEQRFRNTSSKPIMTEEVSRNRMELLSLNEVRLIMLMQKTNNFDEITTSSRTIIEQNRGLREARMKSLNEMEELKRVQGSTFDGQGNGVPKACRKQAAADPRGSRTCVCAIT